MKCEMLQDMFVQYHLGELDELNASAIKAHLAGDCAACKAEMADILNGIDLLFDATRDAPVSPDLKTHVQQIVKAQQTADLRPRFSELPANYLFSGLSLLGSLAAGLLVMMLIAPLEFASSPRASNIQVPPQIQAKPPGKAKRQELLEGIARVPANLRLAQDQFRTTHFVSIAAPATSGNFRGTIVWDPLGSEIHFFGYDFAAPPANQNYVLWIDGEDGEAYPAKTLQLDANGSSIAVVKVRGSFSPKAFVTLEPSFDAIEVEKRVLKKRYF